MRLVRFAFSLLLPFAFVAAGFAQSVHWDPPSGSIPVGQTTGLRLVFDECGPKSQVTPPKVADLVMQFQGQGSNTSIINGTMSSSEVLTFAIALTKSHPVDIPSFQVETNKGTLRVPAAHFEPAAATVGRTNTPLESAATAKLTVAPASVWAGEVFDLTATVEAARSYYPQFTRGFDWTPDPLIAESWSDPQGVDFVSNGEPHTGFQYRARALARSPGRFNLNAATHIVNLSVGVSGFGFFQQRQYDQYSITSNTPTLEIKALPASPAGFNGAVGQFTLTSKVVPEKAGVGEPITWTLELAGTGNWPDIAGLPSREVSNDFHVVQPKAKRTPAEGKIFDVTLTEDVVLVPTKPGSYPLGPIQFVYFDPKSGSYKTLTAPRTTVTITAPSKPLFNLDNNAGGASAEAAKNEPATTPATTAPIGPVSAAAAPAGIPRDPLSGSDEAAVPMTPREVVGWMALPFGLLLLAWITLALRQARRTDPLRLRREARARLGATLAQLRTASEAERPARLLAWQHDTAILWQIAHAAPPATALKDAAWSTLWIETDRALYGAQAALPSDWQARAEAAFTAKRLPGFQPLRLFLPRNLFPFAALLAFAFLFSASKAEDPAALYRKGDFAGAEKAWRERVAQHPTDWVARYNLSLALEQQERVGEAQAQAAAAFVQHPGDEAVRWHFRRISQKAGVAPGALAAFVAPGINQSLAEHHSPAQWQTLLIAVAYLGAFALGLVLFNAYRGRSLALLLTAWGVVVLSFCGGIVSLVGYTTYEFAADARAVVVARAGTLRSIPTEADTQQKTTPLTAGSLAIADNTFLGWTHLAFENGQTGWVRKEEIVALWK